MTPDEQNSGASQPTSDDFDNCQVSVLEKAVDKLLRFAELVGVTPEEMIRLLDSGLTIGELLNYLTSRKPSPSKCPLTRQNQNANMLE